MDVQRHKTLKKPIDETMTNLVDASHTQSNSFKKQGPLAETAFATLLEDSAREAYSRPWHRIERGLRLNRLRFFVDDIAPQYIMNKEEKDGFFLFLQKALDKKLLNTLKIVNYDQGTHRIVTIKGLDIKRHDGTLSWGFSTKKPKTIETRKRKKEDLPSVSTKIEQPDVV